MRKYSPLSRRPDRENLNLYQRFEQTDEVRRIALHYSLPPEFFILITGGEWNTYSASIFEGVSDITRAQERKLDLLACMMQLRPGMKILDIGSGWGGPLIYLCKKYGVEGVGVSVTASQIEYSRERAAAEAIKVEFKKCHWQDLAITEAFDAIYTDEVVVHINRLYEFFCKCRMLLGKGGILVNKELHLADARFKDWSGPVGRHVNGIFGYTGNYRLVDEEIAEAMRAGLEMLERVDIDVVNYKKTIQDVWIPNLKRNKSRLISLTSEETVEEFYKYLRCCLLSFRSDVFELNALSFVSAER
jgi:cyclopropane-fatty-acyl-phospholipid synthase